MTIKCKLRFTLTRVDVNYIFHNPAALVLPAGRPVPGKLD